MNDIQVKPTQDLAGRGDRPAQPADDPRHDVPQSHRHVADVPVLRARKAWPTTGTSSISAAAPWAARVWSWSRRRRSPATAASRPATWGSGATRTSSRWPASPASSRSQGAVRRHPARPRRPQGELRRALERRREPLDAERGRLAGRRPRARSRSTTATRRRRRSTRPASTAIVAAFEAAAPARARGRVPGHRDPRGARLPAARVPLAAQQSPHATTTAAAWRTACGWPLRVAEAAAGPACRDGLPAVRAHLGHRLGRGRLGHRAIGRARASR